MSNVLSFKPRAVVASRRSLENLSFVRRQPASVGGYDYWAVEDSGDREADYAMGTRIAAEYLEYVGEHATAGNERLLGDIVTGMARTLSDKGRLDASALGFLLEVNRHAMAAAVLLERRT